MSESLIHLKGVTRVFVTDEVETHALAGIELTIDRGEYVSISGPSGCGKSTLLAILGLLDSPSEGTYLLKGGPVQDLKMSERARIRNREIGFIFQAFNLIGDLTVYENVELPLTYRGMPGSDRKKRAQEALRARRNVAPDETLPGATFGWPAAEGGGGSRPGGRSLHPSRRRAHRQSGFCQWRGRDGSAGRVKSRRFNYLCSDT